MRVLCSHQPSRASDERCDGCHPPQHDKVMFVSTKSRLGRGVFGGVREVQSPRRVHITPSTVGSWGWKASSVINHPQEKGVPYSITNTQESRPQCRQGVTRSFHLRSFSHPLLVCQPYIDHTSILNSKHKPIYLLQVSSFLTKPATTTLWGKQHWACSLIKLKETTPWIWVMTGEQGGEGTGSKKTASKNCWGKTWRNTLTQPVAQEGFWVALMVSHSENNVQSLSHPPSSATLPSAPNKKV